MRDEDLVAQIAQLRAHQEQTDQSLVALASALEDLIERVEGLIVQVSANATAGTMTVLELMDASRAAATVKERHQHNRWE
jgi:hypothetical protein